MLDLNALVTEEVSKARNGIALFTTPIPLLGELQLAELRAACQRHGTPTFSVDAETRKLRVRLDLHTPFTPVLALNMIARDDAGGLARAIQSALPFVDEIVIGIDGRSDEETRHVAQAWADTVVEFTAADLQLSEDDWKANKMHFANARNHSRALVRAPWTLFVDTDEVFSCKTDLRTFLRQLREKDPEAIAVMLHIVDETIQVRDVQRLALTRFRFSSPMHNQLGFTDPVTCKVAGHVAVISNDCVQIIHKSGDLRSERFRKVREAQREFGLQQLAEEAAKGDLSALYHVAQHYLTDPQRFDAGVQYAEDLRLRVLPHDERNGWMRVAVAFQAALGYGRNQEFERAELWATRVLLDEPNVNAFVLLGDLAELRGDLPSALSWFEAACAVSPTSDKTVQFNDFSQRRFEERDRLRAQLTRQVASL